MVDNKKIKQTDNSPKGIMVLDTGGLAIDMGEIKNIVSAINCIDIEYYDGTKITWWPVYLDQLK
jgi:dTDP-4-amino-4,6-dideoxygalactose transaminase